MRIVLTTLFFMAFGWSGVAQAQGYVIGLATGLLLTGPGANSSNESVESNIMYLAPEDVRKGVVPIDVRTTQNSLCEDGSSVREVINRAIPSRHKDNFTVLRVTLYVATGKCPTYLVHYVSP